MKPVCLKCHLEMQVAQVGMRVQEMMNARDPYRIWSVDTFKCGYCDYEVAVRFAKAPLAEHFEPGWAGVVAQLPEAVKYWHELREVPNYVLDGID